MSVESIDSVVIGGGQAGIAMSEHLGRLGIPHLVLERHRIAERWRSERWDSLVANGPAWHDRFPGLTFDLIAPDAFASKNDIARYFENYAEMIGAPIRCGVEVLALSKGWGDMRFRISASTGVIETNNVIVATGPFQRPTWPRIVPSDEGIVQLHSNAYKNPAQVREGAVLVVGAGSSGAQIADELLRAGRDVYLSIGPHNRPPRRYRGRDFCWWLGALGRWDATAPDVDAEHVTIAVSGAHGGHTVDFRELAARGMTLLGVSKGYEGGVLKIADDLGANIAAGDADYLSVLGSADAYVEAERLDLPEEPDAWVIAPDPKCVSSPVLELDLKQAGISTIIWATGYAYDYSWIDLDVLDAKGAPRHRNGASVEPGLYFLGLPWLTRRASPFIWGVWHDAQTLAQHIATQPASVVWL